MIVVVSVIIVLLMLERNINSHASVRASGKSLNGDLFAAAAKAPGASARLLEAEGAAEELEVWVRVGPGELVGLDLAAALDALAGGLPRTTERAATVASCRTAWGLANDASRSSRHRLFCLCVCIFVFG